MPISTQIFGAFGFGAAAIAFAVLSVVLVVFGFRNQLQRQLMVAACVASCLWTGLTAYGFAAEWTGALAIRTLVFCELARDLLWILVLWSLLFPNSNGKSRWSRAALVIPLIALSGLVFAAIDLAAGLGRHESLPSLVMIVHLTIAIAGVVLTETLYRNSSNDERWRNKFLCLAIGGIFAFDMFFYADAILLRRSDPTLELARGLIHFIIVSLLAIAVRRNQSWRPDLALSHEVVFYSTTFVFGGFYLFLMAIVGFYLRGLGEQWGLLAQVVFLFGALILLAVVLFSGTSRAYLKVFFSKHFFKDRYDYREEWHRFIQTLSEDRETATLEERAVLAVADIVESPGGAVWLKDGDSFVPAGSRNLAIEDFRSAIDSPFAGFLSDTQWVVEIEEAIANPDAYPGLELPDELRLANRIWIIVPLWHHRLVGFMVLARPRAPRQLVWEDFDLLKTVGRQIASYLAEQRAERALTEAREFEEFNRRYAFVIHDIKNIVSQLSLVAANFRKHSSNPAFLEDMIETVDEAVGKMNRITDKINARRVAPGSEPIVALAPVLSRLVKIKQASGANFHSDFSDDSLVVIGDADRLEAVIGHLIQNALEATEDKGSIDISLESKDKFAVISITDDGPGMNAEFVHKELFKPFRSTKGRGFGIGAYQCRAYARELGGRLDVDSAPGEGTTMRMYLPLTDTNAAERPALAATETTP